MSEIDICKANSAEFVAVKRWRGGKEWRPRPHAHDFCEIIVVIAGAERVILEGKTLVAEVGDVMFYTPNLVHHESAQGNTLLEFYCLQFAWKDCPKDMPWVIQDRQGRLLELIRWLNADSLPHYDGSNDYLHVLTGMVVAEMLRLIVSPSQEVVDQVRGFVTDRLTDHMQLEDLAAHCKLNKFHLVRKFRALTGRAPMEYVRDVRLDTALHMLLETDLPLREVAPRVGFADEYHLSRLLKKRYGVGARELRKRLKNESE